MRHLAQCCGPTAQAIDFSSWLKSYYVHGHGLSGRFVYDTATDIRTARLVGFHNSFVRHLDEGYCNSWIVLPLGARSLLERIWTGIMAMLNYRVLAQDDGMLERIEPSPEQATDAAKAL